MKKLVLFALVLTMLVSLVGCGCNHQWNEATCQTPKTCASCGKTEGTVQDHTPGQPEITAVDTETLTVTHTVSCVTCGAELETQEGPTGLASVNGVFPLSPTEWFNCLSTNIYQYGANNTLAAFTAESEDNALVHAVISFNGMKAAFTFLDADGNIITTDQQDQRGLVHSVQVEGLFENATAAEFYQLLMLIGITNNAQMDPASSNTLAGSIMAFETVSNNGYIYDMGILSAEEHKVMFTITAE